MNYDVYKFASNVDRQIEELSDREFFLKKDRKGKVLIEEFYPLSRLALHYKKHGLNVTVEGYGDCGRADGFIKISGFIDREFEVQIACIYNYEDALRAELLFEQGFCPGSGGIKRNQNKEIDVKIEAVDCDEHIGRISNEVVNVIRKKSEKEYIDGTVLLIAFYEVHLYGPAEWTNLFSAMRKLGSIPDGPFSEIFLFNSLTNEIHRFELNRRNLIKTYVGSPRD